MKTKHFNLEMALNGHDVVTKDGKLKVKAMSNLSNLRKGNLVVVFEQDENNTYRYNLDGTFCFDLLELPLLNNVINEEIDLVMVEKPTKIKLELGKLYKTANGLKVIIICYEQGCRPYRGFFVNRMSYGSWREDGCHLRSGNNCELDIISEWED